MLPDALMRRELAILALALARVPDVEQQAALILATPVTAATTEPPSPPR